MPSSRDGSLPHLAGSVTLSRVRIETERRSRQPATGENGPTPGVVAACPGIGQAQMVELPRRRFADSGRGGRLASRRAKTWHTELSLAREAMNARRYRSCTGATLPAGGTLDQPRRSVLLLGECELRRGRREEAMAAWAKVLPSTPSFARAARLRATSLIQMGKYSPAEELLLLALAEPGAASLV